MRKVFYSLPMLALLLAIVPVMAEISFFELCKTGSPDKIVMALKSGATVGKQNEQGLTPLMWAAQYNSNPEVITVFLKNGASVNDKDNSGTTPLMYAAMNTDNPEVILTLLKAGADAKAKNNDGRTAYDLGRFNEKINRTPAYEALQNAETK